MQQDFNPDALIGAIHFASNGALINQDKAMAGSPSALKVMAEASIVSATLPYKKKAKIYSRSDCIGVNRSESTRPRSRDKCCSSAQENR